MPKRNKVRLQVKFSGRESLFLDKSVLQLLFSCLLVIGERIVWKKEVCLTTGQVLGYDRKLY
jgi:hypothetical protein